MPIRTNILFAFFATVLYFFPLELYCLARIYAAYTPFGETLHVFFLHIGNDLRVPKKHLLPHFFNMTVL